MANTIHKRTYMILLCVFCVVALSVHCTKEGEVASRVSRALVSNPDSTVFSPFFDSTIVQGADLIADINDIATAEGVLTIIRNNCSSPACHGSAVKPILTDYASVKAMVSPGNPEASKLFQLITTSDLNRAMPPITYGIDLSVTEKTKIYNWIKNGAKEKPGLDDYRPAAIALIVNGCGSANCHNQATVGGAWARRNLINIVPSDTTSFTYINPSTGARTVYSQLQEPALSRVWNAYKDSVRRFYSDTTANASFRPFKTFNTPIVAANVRGPLNSYDDIIIDILYPKSRRSQGGNTPAYTNPATGQRYWVHSDHLNATSSMLSRVDSTIVLANPRTGVFANNHQGAMAYADGGLSPSEIAQIKAWYFGDPNVPDVWKYGINGNGIFRYRKSGNIIKK